MTKTPQQGMFQEISARVVKRLFLANWLSAMAASGPIFYVAAACVAAALSLGGVLDLGIPTAMLVILVHVLGAAAFAWYRRPSPTAALATWDRRDDRAEMFTSAYCFETAPATTTGEQLHLSRAGARLQHDLPSLPRAIPTKLPHRGWIAPLLFLVAVVCLPDQPAESAPALVDDDSRQRARQVAESLAERSRLDDEASQLTDEEKQKIKALEKSVDEAINKLNNLDDATRRDVLKELQQRADAAEKIAESMAGARGDPLSSELIGELARHADTTDFASALQADDLERMANEAVKLGDRLEAEDLTEQERTRIKKALDSALKKATPRDKQTELAKQLARAKQNLNDKKPRLAAKKLKELSKNYRRQLQRRNTQQQLRRLARRLHRAGQNVFGPRNAGIRRLARKGPANTQPLNLRNLQRGSTRLLQRRPGNPGQLVRLSRQQPGLPSGSLVGPIPGQAPLTGPGGLMPGHAPIPGQGQTMIPGQGQSPIPGQGAGTAAGQGAGQGGHQAGHGTAAVGGGQTSPFKATSTDRVNARVAGDGPATVRNIEPGEHLENSELSFQELALQEMSAEEQALADEPIPLSRREQVLRYFTALRRQLSNDESADRPDAPGTDP